jgi:AbrB family looped-hinge helix DNA binding protein
VIPARVRKSLRLKQGDTLVYWIEGDRLILRPRRAVEEELWAQFKGIKSSLAEELIVERCREAEREG